MKYCVGKLTYFAICKGAIKLLPFENWLQGGNKIDSLFPMVETSILAEANLNKNNNTNRLSICMMSYSLDILQINLLTVTQIRWVYSGRAKF